MKHKLTLEVNAEFVEDGFDVAQGKLAPAGLVVPGIIATPNLNPDFWQYRVKFENGQAILGFPKFHTIGIGFALEQKEWNVNLPYDCTAKEIFAHIKENAGDGVTDKDVMTAIRMVQKAAAAWMDFLKKQRDEKILSAMPMLRGEKGGLMTASEFSKACLVHEQGYKSGYDVLFGADANTRTWKCHFTLWHLGDRRESFAKLYSFLIRKALGSNDSGFNYGVHDIDLSYNSDRIPFHIYGRSKSKNFHKKENELLSA